MRILFLSRWFPFPADNGSKLRIRNLLKGLSEFHEVTLFSFFDPKETNPIRQESYPFCAEVQLVPWKPFNSRSRTATFGFFRLSPRSLLDTYSSEMESRIKDAVSSREFDVIIASELAMASYFSAFGGIPAIFEDIELGLFFDQAFVTGNWMRRLRLRLTWFKLQQYFSRILDSFTACTVVSDQERQIFTDNFPRHVSKVNVLPNCINISEYQTSNAHLDQRRILFSGSFRYDPNYQAMQWFVRDVFPLILAEIPDVQLIVTGDHANLPLPSTKNITLAGYVDDIKGLIASCDVSLAPLWSGGGTRLKILEAMAIGTPVVATSKGAEGLLVQNGENILIADDPSQFASHVVSLLQRPDFRRHLSSNALRLVRDKYDWSSQLPRFLQMVEQAVIA